MANDRHIIHRRTTASASSESVVEKISVGEIALNIGEVNPSIVFRAKENAEDVNFGKVIEIKPDVDLVHTEGLTEGKMLVAEGDHKVKSMEIAAEATQLASEASATSEVTIENNTLKFKFGIPKGAQGEKGEQGESGATGPQGERGANGLGVSGATYVREGSAVTVTLISDSGSAIGSFVLYDGAKGEQGESGATGPQGERGADGYSLSALTAPEIVKSGSSESNIYTAFTTDGRNVGTVEVWNGARGNDGGSPYINEQGYWVKFSAGTEIITSVKAQGDKGEQGESGATGPQGLSISSVVSARTDSAVTITIKREDGEELNTFTIYDGAKGERGEKGEQGIQGATGLGVSGISATRSDSATTVTVIREDGEQMGSFVLYDGHKGEQGQQGEQGPQGATGLGISGITSVRSDSATTVTVIREDGEQIGSFVLYDGQKGEKGEKGEQGEQGISGATGPKGENGINGQDGANGLSICAVTSSRTDSAVTITFKREDDRDLGSFVIYDGAKGERGEKGEKGEQGEQGISGATGPQGIQGPTGPQGIQGAAVRGPFKWVDNSTSNNRWFFNGQTSTASTDSEKYLDLVILENGNVYRCITTFQATSTQTWSNVQGYFTQDSNFTNVSNGVLAKNTSGNIVGGIQGGTNDSDIDIWAGAATPTSGKFKVDNAGNLSATSITASEIKIGVNNVPDISPESVLDIKHIAAVNSLPAIQDPNTLYLIIE